MKTLIPLRSRKRPWSLWGGMATLFLLGVSSHVLASDDEHWVTTWATSPSNPSDLEQRHRGFENATLWQTVHTSISGERVRIRLSNADGTEPIKIGAARIAIQDEGASIVAATDRVLTFAGSSTVTIPTGEHVISDPVDLEVPAQADLAIRLFFPEATGPPTTHQFSMQTNYLAQSGDFTERISLEDAAERRSWYFLTAVEVYNEDALGTVVAVGDSITDGTAPVNSNRRWPDLLARRFAAHPRLKNLGVANAGIGGNRLLYDTPPRTAIFGRSLLRRFERDVVATTRVTHAIVLIGINDITRLANLAPDQDVSVEEFIQGYRQLVERAHAKNIKVIGATLTPYGESNWFSEDGEKKRLAINEWIRTSDELDGWADFDEAVRDPENPSRIRPGLSEDMLHPNVDGYSAMVDSIDLTLFE